MDILSPALALEETFYAEGLALGSADGSKAGLAEGRRFGLEKGFEKFASMGHLHGRSIVWNTRATAVAEHASTQEPLEKKEVDENIESRTRFLPQLLLRDSTASPQSLPKPSDDEALLPPPGLETILLRPLSSSSSSLHGASPSPSAAALTARLQKHVATLYALTEPESLALENSEDAVAEFEDRFRRAVAKAAIVVRIVGEAVHVHVHVAGDRDRDQDGLGGREDSGARTGAGKGEEKGEGELEDIVWRGSGTTGTDRQHDTVQDSFSETEIEIR